ncbi:NAD(P)/FAD-dependent oxidoreductase [Chryseobacterium sp. Ch-15]|uniref:NAD(P)/FAD-dependent oxidoreductase n=1 Tax=Chryseobacterium muglaense TaxID=2893752 RepID=A0A9Q3UVU0_9FLAO|nr:NAD(P)/FAD-dependent oxidoreductase [Chryseobacterium muglaense]MBD3906709.1 NAD(P)/FAD-dependent oxidoreductase [Chryseobacterium muglaense]MCC9036643.1 NAD(P)/FAD-dependent oxidoreductase [Chryseobacterium muglaense]MCM2556386.1 NAD(P)/FAD-dependent oxidoreductase [Chryseobacterium muglaense]
MREIEYEVIIIGGSYSGLSAAMALGRSLRKTLVIDSGKPCNEQTPHSHNFLTQDGKTPKEITESAKMQVSDYETVHFHQGKVVDAKKTETSFEIITEKGEKFHSKKLIIATGITDEIPNIKGFKESWGISLIHCPYCHGYEYKGKKTAIIANGDKAVHISSLVKNLTEDVTIITRGNANFTDEQLEKLRRNNIQIIESEISELKHQNGIVESIIFSDQSEMQFDAVYGAFPFHQHSEIPKNLGCEFTEFGHIKTDQFQKTNVPGLFVCGDNSSMMRSVSNAVMTGNVAGAMVNMELVTDCF